jgi:hypothetical protein
MKYSVVWTSEAIEDFLELRLTSAEKTALTHDAEQIGEDLAKEPFAEKHEVFRGVRIAMHGRLGVEFRIGPRSSIVTVIAAWLLADE